MKNIKELGLELIELENQVLLVRSGQIPDNWYLDDANQIRQSITHDPDWWCARKGYCSIIASTKPLEGLPLLVIEDEVETAYYEDNDSKIYGEDLISVYREGYEKAKLHYKFSEEDLVRAFNVGTNASFEAQSKNLAKDELMDFYSKKLHNLIQSLTKKELWIEIEGCSDCHLNDGYMSSPNCCKEVQPKITNGKIKAIWK